MEFVSSEEALDVLRAHGVSQARLDDNRVYLRIEDGASPIRLHLASETSTAEPEAGARVISVEATRLPDVIDVVIHKLHLTQVLLVPVGPWRHVFDAVAFSLADNEDWQEVDTTATVELNTRDPLLCEPGDFQTIRALMRALLSDASGPEQGLMLTTTSTPLLVEVVPDGAVRIAVGSQVMADEVAEAFV